MDEETETVAGHGAGAQDPILSEQLLDVYRRLYQRYGPQHWWPGESRLEVVLGAILTQAASWRNVERALANLKGSGLMSTLALKEVSQEVLAGHLRPAVYYNAKARKVKAFIGHLWDGYDGDLDRFLSLEPAELRRELLRIHGIGEETADDILVYAAEVPSFVVDTYTRRILRRLGLAPASESYHEYQDIFHRALAAQAPLYNEYHALLDRHAKETCRVVPLCRTCCLRVRCPTADAHIDTSEERNL